MACFFAAEVNMTTAYVRTLPHYVPWLRAWRPVKIKILVCDSKRQRVDVHVTLQEVDGRFGWLLGSKSIVVTCWSDIESNKDVSTGEVTIWPRASGKPSLLITSPDGVFPSTTVEARDAPESVATFHSVDAKSSIDDRTYRIRRAKRLARKFAGPSLGLAGIGMIAWMSVSRTATESSEVILTPVEQQATIHQESVASSLPKPSATAIGATRRDCLFVDPDRTQDANGKVTVMCSGALYQATATYLENGCFQFSDLTATPR